MSIAVDLDGTLAYYDKWVAWNVIGDPIPTMVQRVKQWLAEGKEVYIFTARASRDIDYCKVTNTRFTRLEVVDVVREWCITHIGQPLPVTATKFVHFHEIWDDRAVQVIPNTGKTLAEEHESILNAERGKP